MISLWTFNSARAVFEQISYRTDITPKHAILNLQGRYCIGKKEIKRKRYILTHCKIKICDAFPIGVA